MEMVFHGESSHAGCMRTTRNGFKDDVAQAKACKIVFRMSSGSYSGFARHEPVQRQLSASKRAPKMASSWNVMQKSTFGFIQLLSGLENISHVVSKHACMADERLGGFAH